MSFPRRQKRHLEFGNEFKARAEVLGCLGRAWLEGSGITPEFKIRKWRFDFAFPRSMVLVELHGFGFGHQRIGGLIRDCVKVREAVDEGWVVYPITNACLGSKEKSEDLMIGLCNLIAKRMGAD